MSTTWVQTMRDLFIELKERNCSFQSFHRLDNDTIRVVIHENTEDANKVVIQISKRMNRQDIVKILNMGLPRINC